MKTITALALAALFMGCAGIQHAKQAPQQSAKLRAACESGSPSACIEYKDMLEVCGHGHAFNGAMNVADVSNCAMAVRRAKAN